MIILMQLLITVLAISMYVVALVAIYDEWIN